MSRIVQVKGDRPVFPGHVCIHCLSPSTRQVEIVKFKETSVRQIEVPFCDECIALRGAKTSRQKQFERLAVVASLLLAGTVGVWVYTRASHLGRWVWGALLGVLVALIVFGLMYMVIRPWSAGFRSPQTRAVLRAVAIRDFDWETTTLEFANEEYGERFAQVNQKE